MIILSFFPPFLYYCVMNENTFIIPQWGNCSVLAVVYREGRRRIKTNFTDRFCHFTGLFFVARLKNKMHPQRCSGTWHWNHNIPFLYVVIRIATESYSSHSSLPIWSRREINNMWLPRWCCVLLLAQCNDVRCRFTIILCILDDKINNWS